MADKNSVNESIAYYSVKFFALLCQRLPRRAAAGVGRVLGTAGYYIARKHRRQVYLNLRTAFAADKTPEEIRRTVKKVFVNFGLSLVELFRLPAMTQEELAYLVKLEGSEHVEAARQNGKGLIFLAMHYGSWELANMASSRYGRPYKLIVRPQTRARRLETLLNSYRRHFGAVIVERGFGVRELIRSLKANEIVAMVVDQGGRNGVAVPFFGRRASMSAGAIRIGLKYDVPVCFVIIHRGPSGRHRLVIEPPLALTRTGNDGEDVRANLEGVVRRMEKYITEDPAEYMWTYKVWKYSPDAVLAILDDGKMGHRRQSEAVAQWLAEALAARGLQTASKTIGIVYQGAAARRLMSILALVAPGLPSLLRLKILKWLLTDESYRQIFSVKPDYVVSCGSAAAQVNFLLRLNESAKSVTILRPGLIGINNLDLVILPEHDRRNRTKWPPQVVFTRGAPNLMTGAYIAQQRDALLRRFSHLKTGERMRIGLLLGGDTRKSVLTEQRVRVVVNQLREVAEEMNAELLVTTSRRTPPKVESMLVQELKRYPACRLLVFATRSNVPEALPGILGLSDIVVVSGDSISMISEAATSGVKTIVFPVRPRRKKEQKNKHTRFVDHLHAAGCVLSSEPRDIKQAIYHIVKNKISLRRLDDREAIREGLRRLI